MGKILRIAVRTLWDYSRGQKSEKYFFFCVKIRKSDFSARLLLGSQIKRNCIHMCDTKHYWANMFEHVLSMLDQALEAPQGVYLMG